MCVYQCFQRRFLPGGSEVRFRTKSSPPPLIQGAPKFRGVVETLVCTRTQCHIRDSIFSTLHFIMEGRAQVSYISRHWFTFCWNTCRRSINVHVTETAIIQTPAPAELRAKIRTCLRIRILQNNSGGHAALCWILVKAGQEKTGSKRSYII